MFRVKNSSQKPSCPAPRPNEDKRLISNRKKRNTFKQNRNLITKKNSDTRKGYKYEAIDKKIVVFSLCRCIVKTCLVKTKRVILRLKSKIANFFFSFFSSKFNRIFFLSHQIYNYNKTYFTLLMETKQKQSEQANKLFCFNIFIAVVEP